MPEVPAPASEEADRPRHLTAHGEDRRADIVSQAEQLFAEKGYANTRMTDIAGAAGVTKGLLYWYFENKQALIAEILNETRRRLRVAQQEAIEGIEHPLARIYLATAASTLFILENYRLYLIGTDSPERTLASGRRESAQAHAQDTARAISQAQEQGLVRDDASPLALAFANAGVVNNLAAAAFYRGLREPAADVARTAADYVVRACAADPDVAEKIIAEHAETIG